MPFKVFFTNFNDIFDPLRLFRSTQFTFTATANLELSNLYAENFQSFANTLIFTIGKRKKRLSVTES